MNGTGLGRSVGAKCKSATAGRLALGLLAVT